MLRQCVTYVMRTNKIHTFYINVLFNYSVFDMFRTSKCSSSGRLVYAEPLLLPTDAHNVKKHKSY